MWIFNQSVLCIQVVSGPAASTTTALPPVALRSESEKIVIVYPSNARDERKIRSHSYPEEMQFEALYRHTAAPAGLRVDLPTFAPPTSSPAPGSTPPPDHDRFIPILFPKSDKLKANAKPTWMQWSLVWIAVLYYRSALDWFYSQLRTMIFYIF